METTVLFAKPSKSWRFILSRVDDRGFHSKKWIIGYALLFWLVTRILAGGVVAGCAAIYERLGFTPDEMARFASSADQIANSTRPVWYILMMTLLVAPLLEEMLFRLGLSFRKWQVAVSAAMIPGFMIWYVSTLWVNIVVGLLAVAIFFAVMRYTTQAFWDRQKRRWFIPAVWLTTIVFGLLHLMAFTGASLIFLPYMLCMTLVVFFAGCSIAYLRVNLGFGYGLGMHIFNNLPVIAFLLV